MSWKNDSGSLVRESLGRMAFVGELYNIRNESLSSRSLFKRSLCADQIQLLKTPKTELEYRFTESLSDRFDFLNIEGELQVSVLCDIVKVEGSGKYLKEKNESGKNLSCSLMIRYETVCERLFVSFDEIIKHVDLTALSDPEYTHVIVEINWGANCLLTLEAHHNSEKDKKIIQGKLSAEFAKLGKLLKADGRADMSCDDSQSSLTNRVKVKVCADVVWEKGMPTSVESFHEFVNEIPHLLEKTNDGKGKPLSYAMIPLTGIRKAAKLESVSEVMIKTIDESFLISIMCLFDEIAHLKQNLVDLLEEMTEFKAFINDETIKQARKHLETLRMKESELKMIISEEWVPVKSGEKSLKELVRSVEKFRGHNLCLFTYEDYLESCAAIHSKINTMRNFESLGVTCIGKGKKFADLLHLNSSSEFIVLATSSEFEKNDPSLYQNVSHYFVTLVADKSCNTKYVYVDLDFVLDASTVEKGKIFLNITLTEVRCIHLIGTRLASSDLYSEYLVERESNFVLLGQGIEIEVITHKPGNRVLAEITCPGFQSGRCASDKRTWTCFRCKRNIEYAFDNYFYCACGRALTSGYEYKCSDLLHGSTYLPSNPENLNKELSMLRPLKELNILILGQSGVGKSTWINSIINYLSYESLQEAREGGVLCKIPAKISAHDFKTKKKYIISIGDEDQNEQTTTGDSATQCCRTYCLLWEDRYVRIIDTPGLADTRGIHQDKENMSNIIGHIGNLREIHGVCILMKANESKITTLFSYCLKELLVHLHKSVARNIVFCFTNARNWFYTPGQTSALLEKLLEGLGVGNELALGPHNMFCLDNEAFLFLCTLKEPEIQYDHDLVASFDKSWEISLKETKRLFQTIKSFQPHSLKETTSLVTARSRILTLTKPIAEISKTIQLNLSAIERKQQEISTSDQNLANFAKKLKINEIHLEPVPLSLPRTVCTSPRCVEYHRYSNMDVTEIEYKTHCHVECYLKNVTPKTINNHQLQHCEAMTNGVCKVCGCSWQNHMHLTVSQKRVEKEATNKHVESSMEKERSVKEEIEKFVEELKLKTEKYKEEQDIIIQTSVKFGMFLKENAITVYNDSVAEYLNYLISEEENKPYKSQHEEDLLKSLKDTLAHYEAEVRVLQEVLNKSESVSESITVEDILRLEQKLYKLELTGEQIRTNVEANRRSYKTAYSYSETPLDVRNRPQKKNKKKKNWIFF